MTDSSYSAGTALRDRAARPINGAARPAFQPTPAQELAPMDKTLAKAAARTQEADAKAARLLRVKAEEARLAHEAKEADRLRNAQESAHRKAEKATRRKARAAHRAGFLAKAAHWAGEARANSAALYTTGVYGLAVAVAFGGQAGVAHEQFGWDWPAAFGAAGFVEGLALSMALTAQQLRLRGERAMIPRILTWVCALFAAAINWGAHYHGGHWVMAAVLAASSLAGITLWEVRTGARHRQTLRALGLIAQPRPALGLVFALRYPRTWWAAWSASVADPAVRTRQEAIDAGNKARANNAAHKATGRAARQEARVKAELHKAAREAVKAAGLTKEAGPVLEALTQMALLHRTGPDRLAIEATPAHRPTPTVAVRTEPAAPRRQTRPTPAPKADEPAHVIEGTLIAMPASEMPTGLTARAIQLGDAFPDVIPTRAAAKARMGWTSNKTASEAIRALREMRGM